MTASSKTQSKGNASSGRHWPMVVVGMLALNVCVCATTVFFATRDGPVPVEPDYYQRAVDWDNDRATAPALDARGWTSSVRSDADSVSIALTNEAGEPLEGAAVEATAFHRALSRDRSEIRFSESAPGVYRAVLPGSLAGLWELRLRVTHDGLAASATKTVDRPR